MGMDWLRLAGFRAQCPINPRQVHYIYLIAFTGIF